MPSALICLGRYFHTFFQKQYWVSVKLYGFLYLVIENLSVPSISIEVLDLGVTGTCHSGLNSPVLMSPDLTEDHITASTFLESEQTNTWMWKLLDAILTNLITTLSVLTWYGLWELEDLELEVWLKWSHLNSSIATVVLGIIADLIIIILQMPLLRLRYKAKRDSSRWLYAITQAVNSSKGILSSFAACSSFRGW